MRVSLVGTVHGASGLANVVELQAILERLKPDVIFAEIPSDYIDQYCDGSHGSLESIAVAHYREHHQVAVVPVDRAKPADEFFRNAQDMFGKVERTSPDYRRMMDRHSLDTRMDGFPYLNSDRCIRAWIDIYGEVLDTLNWIGVPWLREIYDLWNQTNELRDGEMMKTIEDYALENNFVHGLFLVGAAHRKSVVEKARASEGTTLPRIEWTLDALLDWRT